MLSQAPRFIPSPHLLIFWGAFIILPIVFPVHFVEILLLWFILGHQFLLSQFWLFCMMLTVFDTNVATRLYRKGVVASGLKQEFLFHMVRCPQLVNVCQSSVILQAKT
jgi:cobalamin biosynthesis protein CobD/CbiB